MFHFVCLISKRYLCYIQLRNSNKNKIGRCYKKLRLKPTRMNILEDQYFSACPEADC